MVLPIGKRDLLIQALDKTGCNRLLQLAGTWNGLLVFNYHRVGNSTGSLFDWDLWSATETEFDRQVSYLARHFDVIGIDDLSDVISRRQGRFAMITFDDGYRDNYELAFPILKTHGVPATFFLATGFLDHPKVTWWDEIAWMVRSSQQTSIARNVWTIEPVEFDDPDRQEAVYRLLTLFKQLDGHQTNQFIEFLADATGSGRCPNNLATQLWMTWDMVREMREAGMCFGGHTVNHPILANLPIEEQDLEIGECRLRIERELGEPITSFSYPVGQRNSFNNLTRQCLGKHGFDWAFSYYGGYCRRGEWDRFDIPRVAVETDMTFAEFRSLASLPQLLAR